MKSVNRREFLTSSIDVAASLAAVPGGGVYGANEKVVIGVMRLIGVAY